MKKLNHAVLIYRDNFRLAYGDQAKEHLYFAVQIHLSSMLLAKHIMEVEKKYRYK